MIINFVVKIIKFWNYKIYNNLMIAYNKKNEEKMYLKNNKDYAW